MTPSCPTTNRRQVALLALTLGVVMLGFGIVIPVYPFYTQSMGASGKELGLLIAISPALQLVFSPIWGVVSDRIGRKPVLMVGILGYGISMCRFGLATELWMLYVFRALGALLSAATLPTTYAYISDSTTEEDRSGAMGALGAAMGLSNSFTSLGRIVGPIWAGFSYDIDAAYPFWSSAAAMLVGFVVSLVWVQPEQPQNEAAPGPYPHHPGHGL